MTLPNSSPKEILGIGTGKQASNHVEAFATLLPDARILTKGISDDDRRSFVERQKEVAPKLEALQGGIPKSVDLVVTVTTSKKPVDNEAVRPGLVSHRRRCIHSGRCRNQQRGR